MVVVEQDDDPSILRIESCWRMFEGLFDELDDFGIGHRR